MSSSAEALSPRRAHPSRRDYAMLDGHAFATPNSIKVPIALEERGLAYSLHGINVRKGEQKAPEFLALNPNGKVPVLVDAEAAGGRLVLTESAAILVYLAETTGRLLPAAGETRARVFEQLFFHAAGLGPAFGQAGFFQRQAAEPQPLQIVFLQIEGRAVPFAVEKAGQRQIRFRKRAVIRAAVDEGCEQAEHLVAGERHGDAVLGAKSEGRID